jgi:hypothetical protein
MPKLLITEMPLYWYNDIRMWKIMLANWNDIIMPKPCSNAETKSDVEK